MKKKTKIDLNPFNDQLQENLLSSKTAGQNNISILDYKIPDNNLNFDENSLKKLLDNSIIFTESENGTV